MLICSFQFDAKLTLDGVMTLAAGIIAFIAVWVQIGASRTQLQAQLDADRVARQEEHERQRRAVARGILFEIDDLYRYYIRDVREFLQTADPYEDVLVKAISSRFSMYIGNSTRLAELDEDAVAGIVHFYGIMDVLFSTFQEYKTALDRAEQTSGPNRLVKAQESRILLAQLKDMIPALEDLVYTVSQKLCAISGVVFEAPIVAVANERPRK